MTRTAIRVLSIFVFLAAAQAHAGDQFDTPFYRCVLDSAGGGAASDGRELESLNFDIVAASLRPGQWSLWGKYRLKGDAEGPFGYRTMVSYGSVRRALTHNAWVYSDRAEIIGEEPTSYKLTLHRKSLKGRILIKEWSGYAAIGSPDLKVRANFTCERFE